MRISSFDNGTTRALIRLDSRGGEGILCFAMAPIAFSQKIYYPLEQEGLDKPEFFTIDLLTAAEAPGRDWQALVSPQKDRPMLTP